MEILSDKEIINAYLRVAEAAKDFLLIAIPFFKTNEKMYSKFVEEVFDKIANNKELEKLLIICRTNEGFKLNNSEEVRRLIIEKEIGAKCFLLEEDDLHAKYMINQKKALVSSLNMTDSSFGNYEVAACAYGGDQASDEDKKCYKEILLTFACIYNEDARNAWKEYKSKTRDSYRCYGYTSDYNAASNIELLRNFPILDYIFDDKILESYAINKTVS